MASTRQRASAQVACNDDQLQAAGVAVYLKGDSTCTHRLRRASTIKSPGLIAQLTEHEVKVVDGSADHPLSLPALEKSNSPSTRKVLIQDAAGRVRAWDMGSFSGPKKMTVRDGSLVVVDDFLTDLFEGGICEATCDGVSNALGVKLVTHSCPGQEDKIRWQLCRIPKCCCDGEEEPETCNADALELIDAVLAAGEIELVIE